jgi:hypothetical protein
MINKNLPFMNIYYCTSVYEHHYKIFYIKIAIVLLFQLFRRIFVFHRSGEVWKIDTKLLWDLDGWLVGWFGLWCLTSLSTVFHLVISWRSVLLRFNDDIIDRM